LRISVGCDIMEFKAYYKKARGELGAIEENIILRDPDHLIVWREGSEIIGHAIWHETNTEEHRGGPRGRRRTERCWRNCSAGRGISSSCMNSG